MKSRKGAALIMALVIILISGIVVAGVFRMASTHAIMGMELRSLYVDHTTLRSAVEEMKGRILADNRNAGRMQHTDAIVQGLPINNPGQLRFAPPWRIENVVMSGVGPQTVVVEVYDMTFEPERLIDPITGTIPQDTLARRDGYAFFFPPHLMLEATEIGGIGGAPGLVGAVQGGVSEGGTTAHDAGEADETGAGDPPFAAYLIRARLFDGASPNINTDRPLRIIEQAFVQTEF